MITDSSIIDYPKLGIALLVYTAARNAYPIHHIST